MLFFFPASSATVKLSAIGVKPAAVILFHGADAPDHIVAHAVLKGPVDAVACNKPPVHHSFHRASAASATRLRANVHDVLYGVKRRIVQVNALVVQTLHGVGARSFTDEAAHDTVSMRHIRTKAITDPGAGRVLSHGLVLQNELHPELVFAHGTIEPVVHGEVRRGLKHNSLFLSDVNGASRGSEEGS